MTKFSKADLGRIVNSYTDFRGVNLNIDLHSDENGNFDYKSYVEAQTRVNVKKVHSEGGDGPVFNRIEMVANYIKKHIPDAASGICHGTRRGTEQRDFKKLLNIPVIGTEISHTAEAFPDTIQWDFHEVKEEWLGSASFIFSNSLDHSYDPIKCLNAWMSCVTDDGKIFLQRGQDDLPEQQFGAPRRSPADMFQATAEAFEKIVALAGTDAWIIKYPEELKINNGKRIVVLERKK